MIRDHLERILNVIVLGVTNAATEPASAETQRVKLMACDFRNRERFWIAIYFYVGILDIFPATHTQV